MHVDHHNHDADHSHWLTSFPKTMGKVSARADGSENTRGPFVYFVPKEAICGPKHFGPVPRLHLIANPMAPDKLIGLANPLPSYLTNASITPEQLIPLVSLSSRQANFSSIL
jgi:hypothetical protein